MASVSEVTIGNMALSNIGASSTIESFTENSPEAKLISLWYDFAREQALEAYDWNFARKRQVLAPHAEEPPEGEWGFRYQYPTDCVVAREIQNPLGPDADAIPFKIETDAEGQSKSILTNCPEAILIYTFNQASTTLFSPYFITMFSYLLAHYIAYAITGKVSLKQEMLQTYVNLMQQADAANANEGVDRAERQAEAVRDRGAYGTYPYGDGTQRW